MEEPLISFADLEDAQRRRKVPRWRKRLLRKLAFRQTQPAEPDAEGLLPFGDSYYRPRQPGPNPLAWTARFQRLEDPHLGATIRQARQRLGWSQRRLAEEAGEAGIAHGYLADIELGNRSPTTRTRCDLAWALDLDPAELGVELAQPEPEPAPQPVPAPPPQPTASQLAWLEASRRHEAEMQRYYASLRRPRLGLSIRPRYFR